MTSAVSISSSGSMIWTLEHVKQLINTYKVFVQLEFTHNSTDIEKEWEKDAIKTKLKYDDCNAYESIHRCIDVIQCHPGKFDQYSKISYTDLHETEFKVQKVKVGMTSS